MVVPTAAVSNTTALIGGIVLILATVAIAAPLIYLFRRRSLDEARTGVSSGLTIDAAERMLSDGTIDEREYRLLRRIILGLDVKDGDSGISTSSPPPDDDDENTDEGTKVNPCADEEGK